MAENRKPIINGNPSVEPGYLNDPSKFSTLQSALAVPLEGVAGVVGVSGALSCGARCLHLRPLANSAGNQLEDGAGDRKCIEVRAGGKLGND